MKRVIMVLVALVLVMVLTLAMAVPAAAGPPGEMSLCEHHTEHTGHTGGHGPDLNGDGNGDKGPCGS